MSSRRDERPGALERFALAATDWSGRSAAFAIAVAVVLVWGALGPYFHFSDTWQLVINTGTTIVTFLMVFLIQRAQNKDGRVIQLKLNEIVAALQGSSNRLIDVENMSEREIETLHKHFQRLAEIAERDTDIRRSHSIEEADARHQAKLKRNRGPSARKKA